MKERKNKLDMEFVKISKGSFIMGSEEGDDDEKPVHKVNIDKFYIGKYEVTKEQWKNIMGTEPWEDEKYTPVLGDEKDFIEDPDSPAVFINWKDAQEFIEKLNELTPDSENYRLPSEAEWEYACRAGSNTKFFFGNNEEELGNYAWYAGNAYKIGEGYAHKVGQKIPNPWGLYDMHGNVGEWCQDTWHYNYKGAPDDGTAWEDLDSYRTLRGGSWDSKYVHCRSACRGMHFQSLCLRDTGFRLVLEINKEIKELKKRLEEEMKELKNINDTLITLIGDIQDGMEKIVDANEKLVKEMKEDECIKSI